MSWLGLDWIAGGLELVGLFMTGCRVRWGFLTSMSGCVLWTIVAVQTGVYGLLLTVIPAIALNLLNFWKWSR